MVVHIALSSNVIQEFILNSKPPPPPSPPLPSPPLPPPLDGALGDFGDLALYTYVLFPAPKHHSGYCLAQLTYPVGYLLQKG